VINLKTATALGHHYVDAAVSRYCNRQVPEEATLHNVGADTGTWLSARRDVGPL